MNIQFSLAGTQIETNEALALLAASNQDSTKSNPVIELDKIIDLHDLDANVLFQTAVTTGNQELASLAWKISVHKQQSSTKPKETPNLTLVSYKRQAESLEAIIEYLNSTSSYCSTGVAMVLKMASEKEWTTLRETAIHFANTMWTKHPETRVSKFFRGFELINGELAPIDYNGKIDRKKTFHVSPMYIALREGLLYCTRNNLVEQKRMLSVGAPYTKNPTASIQSTRRIYYKFKATERGMNLTEMWADMDRYINKKFTTYAC